MSRFPLGLRFMAAGAFFFSLMSALVKVGGERFPTMELVLARSVVVLVLSSAALWRSGTGFVGRERGLLVLRGVLGFTALSGFYYGVVHLPLAEATVIQYTNPVWTALIAAAVLGEWIGGAQVALALASLAGVVMVVRPAALLGVASGGLDAGAAAVALGGSIFSAGAYVTVRRLRAEATMVIVFYFAVLSTLMAAPFLAFGAVMPGGWDWALLTAIGVTTHLGQVFLTRGLKLEAAGRAMTAGYLQIVFAAVWGALLFGDVPDAWSFAGAVVIVASTLVLARLPSPGASAPPRLP